MRRLLVGTTMAALMVLQVNAASPMAGVEADHSVFARINDLVISQSEFEAIFRAAVRHKYYHGRVPEDELEIFRSQVADDLVTQSLVYEEALQLGMEPDREKISRGIEAFEGKNVANPYWEARRERVIPQLVARLERQDLIERMEARIRDLPAPDSAAARRYYLDNPDKFTEPERLRLAVILLRVPPAASEELWLETETRLGQLKQRVDAGQEFAALAAEYSEHQSATDGGDLGYLHRGVLETSVQSQVDRLQPGRVSEPIRLLEGIALFQLNGIQPVQLKPFVEVRQRARDLLYREMQDEAWNAYVNTLRSSANVYVSD